MLVIDLDLIYALFHTEFSWRQKIILTANQFINFNVLFGYSQNISVEMVIDFFHVVGLYH
jgi:hypothetical protein